MPFLLPNQQCQSTEGISTEGIMERRWCGVQRLRRIISDHKTHGNKLPADYYSSTCIANKAQYNNLLLDMYEKPWASFLSCWGPPRDNWPLPKKPYKQHRHIKELGMYCVSALASPTSSESGSGQICGQVCWIFNPACPCLWGCDCKKVTNCDVSCYCDKHCHM